MILYKDKSVKEIKPHKWFAWYPVWAWKSRTHDILYFVWLQKVIRTNGFIMKYRYYIK